MNKEELENLATGKPLNDFQYDICLIGDGIGLKITHLPTGLFEELGMKNRGRYFSTKKFLLLKLALQIKNEYK
jgi:hypothetical protein